jgi:hypothetical protein
MKSFSKDEWTGVHRPKLWARTRRRAVDRRYRRSKIMAERKAKLEADFRHKHSRESSFAEDVLLEQLADRLSRQDERRAEQALGIVHDERWARAADNAITRDMMSLGLICRVNDGARAAAESDTGLSDLLNGKPA